MARVPPRSVSSIAFFAIILLALSAAATREIRLSHVSTAVGDRMQSLVNSKFIKEYGNIELRKHYTGIAGLDFGLQFLVLAFLPGVLGLDMGQKLQSAHFLLSVFPLIAILSVEAGRARNKWSLLYFTSIWGLFYQTVGGAVIIPLIPLAYMKTTSSKDYWTASSRAVSLPYARALLPSLVIGYLLPTIALYVPYGNVFTTQGVVALWQPSPWMVNILLVALSTLFSAGQSSLKQGPEGTTADVKYLQRVYLISFFVAVATHWFAIAACFLSPDPTVTFTHAFLPRKDFLLGTQAVSSMHEGILYIFQIDFWFISAAGLIWAYLAILDTNRVAGSYVASAKALSVMAMNTVLFGPAATMAAVWYSREGTLAGLQKSKTK